MAAEAVPPPPTGAPPPATLAAALPPLGTPIPPGSGTMMTGHVKAWIEDRGMGFISPDDGGDDAFIHRCQLVDGVCLLVGSPVVFEDNWDPSKNKRVAKKVTGAAPADAKGAGKGGPDEIFTPVPGEVMQPRGQPTSTIGQMVTGIVKTWKDERGMGFIAPANGGDDAFVHRSSLLDGQWLVVGSPVMFEDNWDHMKSKRIAKNVTGAVSIEGKGAGADMSQYGGKGQAHAPMAAVDTTGMVPGTIKAWYEDRGMGFIRPAGAAEEGEDVFIHRSGLVGVQGVTVGTQVLYQEGWDPNKGKKMALKCVLASQAGAAPGTVAVMGSSGPTFTGVVKAWVDERGMGFILPDGGSEDIFVHRSALLDGQWLMVGARVSFEQGWDPTKNKNIARNVRGALTSQTGAAGGAPGVAADGMRTGTVKMWFVEKAFGFIIPDAGGDDVMVHKNEVAEGHELVQGMAVKFDAVWDPAKGKYKASRCIPAGACMAAPPASGGGKGSTFPPSDNLFVAGLPLGYNEDLIKQVFGQYGTVTSCRVLNNPGKPDLACMVRMADAGMAMWMVENLNGNIPVGLSTPVTVRFAQPVGYGKASGKGFNQNRGSPYPAAAPAALPAPTPALPAAPAPAPAPPQGQQIPGLAAMGVQGALPTPSLPAAACGPPADGSLPPPQAPMGAPPQGLEAGAWQGDGEMWAPWEMAASWPTGMPQEAVAGAYGLEAAAPDYAVPDYATQPAAAWAAPGQAPAF